MCTFYCCLSKLCLSSLNVGLQLFIHVTLSWDMAIHPSQTRMFFFICSPFPLVSNTSNNPAQVKSRTFHLGNTRQARPGRWSGHDLVSMSQSCRGPSTASLSAAQNGSERGEGGLCPDCHWVIRSDCRYTPLDV